MDALARELGVEIYHWEEWTNRGLSGIDASLREREGDLLEGTASGPQQGRRLNDK